MDKKKTAVVALFVTIGVLAGFIAGSIFTYEMTVIGFSDIAESIRVEQITIGLNETKLAEAAVEQIEARGLNKK